MSFCVCVQNILQCFNVLLAKSRLCLQGKRVVRGKERVFHWKLLRKLKAYVMPQTAIQFDIVIQQFFIDGQKIQVVLFPKKLSELRCFSGKPRLNLVLQQVIFSDQPAEYKQDRSQDERQEYFACLGKLNMCHIVPSLLVQLHIRPLVVQLLGIVAGLQGERPLLGFQPAVRRVDIAVGIEKALRDGKIEGKSTVLRQSLNLTGVRQERRSLQVHAEPKISILSQLCAQALRRLPIHALQTEEFQLSDRRVEEAARPRQEQQEADSV